MISIIVKIFNEEKYILGALNSLISQVSVDDEILLIDDGSTDNTEFIIQDFLKGNELANFKYFKKTNGGPGSACNYGLKHVSKDYIMFFDADDELSPNAIPNIKEAIERHSSDVISLNKEFIKLDGTVNKSSYSLEYNKVYGQEVIPKYLSEITSLTSNVYKKEVIDRLDFDFLEIMIAEDINYLFKAILSANSFVYIPDTYYRYFERENSLIHGISDVERNLMVIKSVEDILDYYELKQEFDNYQIELYRVLFLHILVFPIVRVIKKTKSDKKLQNDLVSEFNEAFYKNQNRFTLDKKTRKKIIKENIKRRIVYQLSTKKMMGLLNYLIK